MHKVVAFIEHGFAFVAGQGVGEAVTKVQVGRMAAAFAVVAVSLAGNPCLGNSDRLDDDLRVEN